MGFNTLLKTMVMSMPYFFNYKTNHTFITFDGKSIVYVVYFGFLFMTIDRIIILLRVKKVYGKIEKKKMLIQ